MTGSNKPRASQGPDSSRGLNLERTTPKEVIVYPVKEPTRAETSKITPTKFGAAIGAVVGGSVVTVEAIQGSANVATPLAAGIVCLGAALGTASANGFDRLVRYIRNQ